MKIVITQTLIYFQMAEEQVLQKSTWSLAARVELKLWSLVCSPVSRETHQRQLNIRSKIILSPTPFLFSSINQKELSLVNFNTQLSVFSRLYHILIFETRYHLFMQNVVIYRSLFHKDASSSHQDILPLCHMKSLKPSS